MSFTPAAPQPSTTPQGFFPQPAGDRPRKSRNRQPIPAEHGETQSPADLTEFAGMKRLPLRRHKDDGTLVCFGRLGHLFQYDDNLLGLAIIVEGNTGRFDNMLRSRCRRAEQAGFTPVVVADFEGIFTFHPADQELCRLAVKLAGVRRKRRASASQLENLKLGHQFQQKQPSSPTPIIPPVAACGDPAVAGEAA